jgi:Helix-turn-helix domain
VSEDDVLFGYRLQLVALAGRVGVTAACRTFGVHRSTDYAWKRKIEREGLGALRPRERRRPRMPNQLSPFVEQRIVAFALGHPGWARAGSRPSSRARAGAASSSLATGSGAACAGTGSTPAPSGSASSPATRPRTSRPLLRRASSMSRRSGRVSWSPSTASSSGGCTT